MPDSIDLLMLRSPGLSQSAQLALSHVGAAGAEKAEGADDARQASLHGRIGRHWARSTCSQVELLE